MLDVVGIKRKLPSNNDEYAVVKSNGRPVPVSVGDYLYVTGNGAFKNGDVPLSTPIYKKDGKLNLGEGEIKVHWKLVKFIKGKKITIQRFKNKSRQKVRKGYRNKYSLVKIEKIDY